MKHCRQFTSNTTKTVTVRPTTARATRITQEEMVITKAILSSRRTAMTTLVLLVVIIVSVASSFLFASDVVVSSPQLLDNSFIVTPYIVTPNDESNNNNTHSSSSSSSIHNSLLPLSARDSIGLFCAALGLILAAGGGIGGGGILVPIYILILGFSSKQAIPLSNVTVFGGALANTLYNIKRRHPNANRPLIDWDLIVVMEPPTLGGALIGANLNKIMPETIIVILLVLLLAFTSYGTLSKAWSMYIKETEELRRRRVGSRTVDIDTSDDLRSILSGGGGSSSSIGVSVGVLNEYLLLDETEENNNSTNNNSNNIDVDDEDNAPEVDLVRSKNSAQKYSLSSNFITDYIPPSPSPIDRRNHHTDDDWDEDHSNSGDEVGYCNPVTAEQILLEERKPKLRNVLLIVILFIVVLLINILKGGGGFASPLGIVCGSILFWLAQVLLLLWIVFISWLGRRCLLKDTQRKAEAGYVYLDDDIRWDSKSTIVYPLISTVAGIFAGMFGIGGGIIKGPLMLAMGIHPAVASATSAAMILFTSFTATTTFCVYGLLVRDYAIACVILGFVATYIGQSIMANILARSNRNSYIVFSIGFVVLFSTILMALESVINMSSNSAGATKSSGICESYSHT